MMLSPFEWPREWLPLKRKGPDGFQQIALLGTATELPDEPMQVRINQNIFGSTTGDVEVKHYRNVDAVLDDGWMVD